MISPIKKHACRLVLTVLLGLTVSGTVLADETTFVPGTSVNGLGIGGLTVEEAQNHILQFYSQQYELTIKEKGNKQEVIKGSDIGYSVSLPDGFLNGILTTQNETGRNSGPDVDSRHRVALETSFNEEALSANIQELKCLTGTSITQTQDARVSDYQEGKPFEILKEVHGTNLYPEKVEAAVKAAVASGEREVDLQAADCYYKVNITSDNPELKDLCDSMNRCRSMTVRYSFGEDQEILDGSDICTWLQGTTDDGQLQINRDQVALWVAKFAARHDTSGKERPFHTADGRDITVSGGFYGWQINQSAEINALIEAIRSGQSQEREPIYLHTALTRNADEPEWGTTYAEVDLTNQHVYVVKDGQVVWDAPCVTGNVSRDYTTPPGLFSLTYKERNRILRGKKRADGTYEYETPVSYWMPFNGGIGFHDANWRSSFGGTIYQTNGSHGCVNLPPAAVPALYDLVYTGMPIICYL